MPSSFQEFETKIQNLYEVDIGDFKRKTLLYLTRLEEQLQKSSLKPWIQNMRNLVVCNQTTEVDVLRNQILEEVRNSKES